MLVTTSVITGRSRTVRSSNAIPLSVWVTSTSGASAVTVTDSVEAPIVKSHIQVANVARQQGDALLNFFLEARRVHR